MILKKKRKAEPQSRKRSTDKNSGLTFSEKRRLSQLRHILSGKGKEKEVPTTAQKTITFQKMFKDGICQVTHHFYTRMVQFYDINYELLEVEDKAYILELYSKLINYFDPSVKFEVFLFNRRVNEQTLTEQFEIAMQNDVFDEIREEYTQMLKNQAAKGNNGVIKSKFFIFGVESNSFKEARNRLQNIERDVIKQLNSMGTGAVSLTERKDCVSCMNISIRIPWNLSVFRLRIWQSPGSR